MEPVDATHPTLEQWESGALPERDQLAEELVQLFTSSSVASSSSNANSSSSAEATAARPITRRPGVEEVRNCILSSAYPCIPPSCATLRGEIWQVLLNVYKRNQHGAAAQEFERMIARLSKLPRDPLLVEECHSVSQLLCTDDEDKRAQIQSDLEILLVWFLTTKSVEYARGMARVVGVFFSLQLPLPTVYDCFYQFCASFLPHFVTATPTSFPGGSVGIGVGVGADNLGKLSTITPAAESDAETTTSSASSADADTPRQDRRHRERQQLVEQLVAYHAPQLAHFLNQWCPNRWSKPGELIPQELFFEDAFNAVTPSAFVHVMDQYLLTNDSMVGVFLVVAALLHAETVLTQLSTKDDVAECIRREVAVATRDPQQMAFVGVLASRLRARTPTSYKQALVEAQDAFCASRKAMEIAFHDARTATAKPDVDMSQWQKRESRSFAGKIFWYHTPSGRTQWEHPAEVLDPAPALFALPVGVHEVARQVMGEKKPSALASSTSSSSSLSAPTPTHERLRFFVVDCRALRSSADVKSGRIPAAYTLDPSVFDSPELIERSMGALDAIKSQVHVVLVGDGVGLPPELIKSEELQTSVRDAVRHDADSMNRAALFFQKRGFRFVSCLDGGYSSWHAFMRDDASCAPDELLGHVADECHYCRYDAIVQTGADPRKLKQQNPTRRKKSAMPTTTTLLVNGGEGDASIISTNEGALPHSNNSTSGGAGSRLTRKSLTSSLSLSRTSLTTMNSSLSSMRSKLTMMPKLSGWRRSSSTSSTTAPNDSSSEVDGSSDRGSSTTDEHDHNGQRIAEEDEDDSGGGGGGGVASSSSTDGDSEPAVHAPTSPTPDTKNFVGVFTIDYSDDEDDEEFSAPTSKEATAGAAAPLAAVGESVVATTQSA